MTATLDPVLEAVVRAAVDATGAGRGWILAVDGGRLRVVAAWGEATAALIGVDLPAGAGSAGYVVASGQPLALTRAGDDPRPLEGVTELTGRPPANLVCVPCDTGDGIVGALEVVDKQGSFSFDDVELATLLASIAGAALVARRAMPAPVVSPAELAGELTRLAEAEPSRYATVADAVSALLARG